MIAVTQLRDVLEALRPQIPESLLAGRGRDRLLQRAGDFPAAVVANLCIFELRLDDPEPAADFSVTVASPSVPQHYLAGADEAAATSLKAWLDAYLASKPEPYRWLMIEYDLIDIPEERKAAPAINLRSDASLTPGGAAFEPACLAGTLSRVHGRSDARHEQRALSRTFAVLPSGAVVVFAAAFPERTPRSVRLVVAEVSAAEVGPFLDRLRWPGSIPTVLHFLPELHDVSNSFMMAFDVTPEGALPRLGFEIYPTAVGDRDFRGLLSAWRTTRSHHWRGLINRLAEMGLCSQAKADGLLCWPKQRILYWANGTYGLRMGINHIKIVMDAEHLQAKAYAGLQCFPLAPQSVISS
ncbi:MAG: hypothetical protein F4X09_01450 [Gammaproteobacteria bacterium]|nr:hypothetical protein [Gammaproteobacteria bacterium]